MCLMQSEAKQDEMSEFGAEKGLLQGPCKENSVAHAQNSLMDFREEVLKAR